MRLQVEMIAASVTGSGRRVAQGQREPLGVEQPCVRAPRAEPLMVYAESEELHRDTIDWSKHLAGLRRPPLLAAQSAAKFNREL